jgi:glyoxylase-like metal-dependent hydrolase (beta-lactamase superfamily II)
LSEWNDAAAIQTVPELRLAAGEPKTEMSDGLFGVRLPLPFALDHVNLWLFRDGVGWTLIDTGVANQPTRDFWEEQLKTGLDGRPLERLIATHFHPDHMGLAGWLCEKTGASFWTTRLEWLTARALVHDRSEAFVEAGRRFDLQTGLDAELMAERAGRGNVYRTRAAPPPAAYVRVNQGDDLVIDGEAWRVLIGRGHAPEMIALYSAERDLLIAADQVLQKISPNISVWPGEPDADPLADYFESLEPFRELPETALVLPSHGQPFYGLRARIDELIDHHRDRLERAVDAAGDGRTAVEIMPALFDRKLDAHQLGFALGEAVAHLNHLVFNGVLVRHLDAAGAFRYRLA